MPRIHSRLKELESLSLGPRHWYFFKKYFWEDVLHMYNRILLIHKKEQNWVISSDVDRPRVCHTEWSKSEREKQISYINGYIWNLEKWYGWTYLQGRNRDADRGLWMQRERGGWDKLGSSIDYNAMFKIDS